MITLALASKERNWENQRCKSCTEYFEYVHVTPGPAIFCSFVFCLGSLSPWQGFNFSLVEGKGWPNFMAHDAIPLQSKSLGNKATEGHMPLIFAILLQNFVRGRIFINAISALLSIWILLQVMIITNFAFFFSRIKANGEWLKVLMCEIKRNENWYLALDAPHLERTNYTNHAC